MIFEANQDYYQLLEVDPTASLQEIKAAYLKIKSAYRKDNLALYGMMDSRECEAILHRIEEAYATLSNADTRRDYDAEKRYEEPMRMDPSIPSIDRVPPMLAGDDSDLLSPPMTDIGDSAASADFGSEPTYAERADAFALAASLPALAATLNAVVANANGEASISAAAMTPATSTPAAVPAYANAAAAPIPSVPFRPSAETAEAPAIPADEWTGPVLRKTREARRLSLDEVSSLTRISKTYIQAIEDETFDKLPAPVFVRGFLMQYAKTLKLPHDSVASNYMTRFRKK